MLYLGTYLSVYLSVCPYTFISHPHPYRHITETYPPARVLRPAALCSLFTPSFLPSFLPPIEGGQSGKADLGNQGDAGPLRAGLLSQRGWERGKRKAKGIEKRWNGRRDGESRGGVRGFFRKGESSRDTVGGGVGGRGV